MRLISKPLIVSGFELGEYAAYADIRPDFLPTEKGVRVLPSPFFYEKGMQFALVSRHEPGERFFPKGGYSLREQTSGAIYSYDLDQVIIWPETAQQKRVIHSMAEGDVDEQIKRGRKPSSAPKEPKKTGGRRGRPAMDPEAKAALVAEKAARAQKSGGRRGRPASPDAKPKQAYVSTGGARGRKPLAPEERLKRQLARERKPTGAPRGRPSKRK